MRASTSIREMYQTYGVTKYYQLHGNDYLNPHEPIIHKHLEWVKHDLNISDVLDLCCGSGEVTRWVQTNGGNTVGLDPYTASSYEKNTRMPCIRMSFADICDKGLPRFFQTIICSFAIHLCPQGYYNILLYQLARSCDTLVVIAPYKNEEIDIFFNLRMSQYVDKVQTKIYKSAIEV